MTTTIEEVKRVALERGAFVAIECVTYSLKDGEIVFIKDQLHAFAQHWIEVGRKEQRESDAKLFDGYPNPDGLCGQVTRKSAAKAIRNNIGE